jgi:hypothetical protein
MAGSRREVQILCSLYGIGVRREGQIEHFGPQTSADF